jgi:sugar transferase (PEP-CTERM/EpsH1 system associated)
VRVLYLCHRIPYPPNKGDKIRAFYQLRAMAERHEVDLCTLADDAGDLVHRSALLKYCHDVTVAPIYPKIARLRSLPYLLTRTPLTIPYFHSAELQRAIRKTLAARRYDRIFIYSSAMAQYVEPAGRIPTILDLVDVDSDKWIQYARCTRFPFSALYRREGQALRKYEKKIAEKAACVLVSTEREAQLMHEISAAAHVHVVPNGVDVDYFNPALVPLNSKTLSTTPAIIFTGDMSYFPNAEAVTWFAWKVLPMVRQSIANIRFLIVGRNPSPGVTKLQQIEGVEVTGLVPDVRAHFARAQVAVAPFSIAAGIPNKILEAMAYGLPVVATPRAAQGLYPRVAEMVHTGNTAEELASRLVVLLRDPQLAHRIGLEGRCRVTDDYSWGSALDRLLQLLEDPATAERPGLKSQSSHVTSER